MYMYQLNVGGEGEGRAVGWGRELVALLFFVCNVVVFVYFFSWYYWQATIIIYRECSFFCTFSFYAYIWCTMHEEDPYTFCGQRRPWSACANAQADLGLRCPLTEAVDTVFLSTNKECPEQTARKCTLIWTCAVRIWHKGTLSTRCASYGNIITIKAIKVAIWKQKKHI